MKKKINKKQAFISMAVKLVGDAHEVVSEAQDLELDKTELSVLKSVDLHLAKAISELDYLDKKGV